MNTQKPLPAVKTNGTSLQIHSLFLTIQGEGPYTGHPAVFVRLSGCNLQCPGCDTEYTGGNQMHVDEIVQCVQAISGMTALVVITGGEPFRQNIAVLCDRLLLSGYVVQVESNGTLPPSQGLDNAVQVVCSPKTGSVNKRLHPFIKAYKYVLNANSVDPEDGLPVLALGHSAAPRVARPHRECVPVYLQPMDCHDQAQNEANIKACVKSCLEHGYTLQLQVHKYIGVE